MVLSQDLEKGFKARLIPLSSRASTDQIDAGLAMTVAVWLRKHGKVRHSGFKHVAHRLRHWWRRMQHCKDFLLKYAACQTKAYKATKTGSAHVL